MTPRPPPAETSTRAGALRSDATALEAVVTLLEPESGPAGPVRHCAVLPSPGRPRYVVPAGRAGAAAHLRPGEGRRALVTRWAVRRALRLGTGRLLPGGVAIADGTDAQPGLRRHLSLLLGREDVEVAVALGSPRPNRKPVIQVLSGDGATLAWAKLGVDTHTDALVAHETQALAQRPDAPVVVPEVLASGTWHGHPLLVLGHLDLTETSGDLQLTQAAVVAVATPVIDQHVMTSAWWDALEAEADRGSDPGGGLRARLDDLAGQIGDRTWPFGRWHGDLAPWNATWEGERLLVWDWERAGGPVPLGLDAVHNHIQVAMLRDGADSAAAAASARAALTGLLVALGHQTEDVELVIDAYLVTLRARLAEDAAHGALGLGVSLVAALDAEVGSARIARP